MELTTSWKEEGLREGWEKGLQEGEQRGEQQEALHLTQRLLTRRVGLLPPDLEERIGQLSRPQLEQLFDAAYDFASLDEVRAWLDANPPE